jgi:hypothetical protein
MLGMKFGKALREVGKNIGEPSTRRRTMKTNKNHRSNQTHAKSLNCL